MEMLRLLYHDIVTEGDLMSSGFTGRSTQAYKLQLELFESHLRIIVAQPVPVQLTFDDGGKCHILHTAPLLEKFGLSGIFFIPTAFIGTPGFLDPDDIAQLHQRGHTIGTHSHTHRPLSILSSEQVLEEWKQSVSILSAITGTAIRYASLPGGWYSRKIAEATAESGITILFTSKPSLRTAHVSGCEIAGRYNITAKHTSSDIASLLKDPASYGPGIFSRILGLLKYLSPKLYLWVRERFVK